MAILTPEGLKDLLNEIEWTSNPAPAQAEIIASHSALSEENARLREALGVYAKEANWCATSPRGKFRALDLDLLTGGNHGYTLAKSVLAVSTGEKNKSESI
jgi:hypothetical protein